MDLWCLFRPLQIYLESLIPSLLLQFVQAIFQFLAGSYFSFFWNENYFSTFFIFWSRKLFVMNPKKLRENIYKVKAPCFFWKKGIYFITRVIKYRTLYIWQVIKQTSNEMLCISKVRKHIS